MLLNKEQILKASVLPFRDVEVPEWGGTVRIKTMTAAERDKHEAEAFKLVGNRFVPCEKGLQNAKQRLLSKCLVDEQFNPLFKLDELACIDSRVRNRLAEIALAMNGMEDVEEEVKN